ncbi:hypothetical protein X757_08280 [Mesorhizobium sp. LSHC414A00]|nr:hypothetical protein X757_08280 [Mesorhizobium sp. LSHC414A00]
MCWFVYAIIAAQHEKYNNFSMLEEVKTYNDLH